VRRRNAMLVLGEHQIIEWNALADA